MFEKMREKILMAKGITLIEIMIVIAVLGIITSITFNSLVGLRNSQSLEKDTETIVETLRQARSQTLSSENSSQYGVHFSSPTITVFTGGTYTAGDSNNMVYTLFSTDTLLTISLTGGGNDVVFNRLSGETGQNGTIVVSSRSSGSTKTVTIYKTGLVEYQ